MSDKLNTTTGSSLVERFDLNGTTVKYSDYKNRYNMKKPNIELSDFGQPQNNYIIYTNGVKNVDFEYSKRNNLDDEEDSRQNSSSKSSNNSQINSVWSIRQTLNVIIFIKKLKEYCRRYLFKSITRYAFNVIGDQSSQYNYYIVNCYIKSKEKMSILMKWREVRQKKKVFQQQIRQKSIIKNIVFSTSKSLENNYLLISQIAQFFIY